MSYRNRKLSSDQTKEIKQFIRKNRSIYGFLNVKTEREHAFKTEKQNGEINEL